MLGSFKTRYGNSLRCSLLKIVVNENWRSNKSFVNNKIITTLENGNFYFNSKVEGDTKSVGFGTPKNWYFQV